MQLNKDSETYICDFLTHIELVVHSISLQMTRNRTKHSLTNRSRGFPSLKRINVGNASILYLSAMTGYFSVSILTTWTVSLSASLTFSRIGTMNWQGPHLQTRSYGYKPRDINHTIYFIMKIWRKCWNYQKIFQFMWH